MTPNFECLSIKAAILQTVCVCGAYSYGAGTVLPVIGVYRFENCLVVPN